MSIETRRYSERWLECRKARVSVTMFRLSEKLVVHGGVFMARKSSRWIAGIAVASAAMLIVFAGSLSATKTTAAQAKASHMDLAAEKSMGTKSAPITLEVYSDFQCPSCKQFFLTATTPLMNDYVASGK